MSVRWLASAILFALVSWLGFPNRVSGGVLAGVQPLSYRGVAWGEMGVPKDLQLAALRGRFARELPGRRIPETVAVSDLMSPELRAKAVPLPQANTLSHWYYQQRWLGCLLKADGAAVYFAPQTVLVKFRGAEHVAALRVEPMREVDAVERLAARADVAFAELDVLQYRQFSPDDPQVANQWQHTTLGSFEAWNISLGREAVRVAIVDSPFQMDHPDLAANTAAGWSVITNAPITESAGIDHSTAAAGMAAAVINNHLGVAGAGNSKLVPIHIVGFPDDMYNAVIWAADHDVRVVNLSWSGADSPTLNEAGLYLKTRARGVLAMSGVNGIGPLEPPYPNQPYLYCISMTDAADNLQSCSGDHIDFAAPGYEVFTTLTGSAYGTANGTSFATPLFCGVVAVLFSINPTLSPDEVIDLLKATAEDKGPPGWDPFFGWGRIHFGRAAAAAQNTLPKILGLDRRNAQVTISARFRAGPAYSLWKTPQLSPPTWSPMVDAIGTTNGSAITFTDLQVDGTSAFYRILAQ